MTQLNAQVLHGFVKSCLVKKFDGSLETPACHLEWWDLCTSKNKYVAISAPRGHAKSTAITLSYGLATILFRERKFVLIVSDTEAQATLFLGQLKQELSDNEDIVSLFGVRTDPDTGKVKFEKDSETDCIVTFTDGHKCRIIAKGAEQKLRGLLWNGSRPDLILIDDLENDEIVMNKDRREKFRRWFYGALMPCLSKDGIVRYVGTILHMDALLERLMPVSGSIWTKVKGLKTYSERPTAGWISAKYEAHNDDFSLILWPAKWDEDKLREERSRYVAQGLGDVYEQEYRNRPIDESTAYFRKSDFLPIHQQDVDKNLIYYISADLAISEKERSDWSVFVVGGLDENGVLHIKHVVRDRMDSFTIVSTIMSLQRRYKPMLFGIEDTQITKAIGPYLREAMRQQNTYPNILPLKPHKTDKITRARSIQARMKAGAVKFDKDADWYNTLESEMQRFPRDRHDDQVDAMSYLGLMIDHYIEAPSQEELEEEEYYEEYKNSGLGDSGRSNITGY